MDARIKPSVYFSHDALSGDTLPAGVQQAPQWHRFSTTTFAKQEDATGYIRDTGLEQTGHVQSWDGGTPQPIFRSRRGSVAGLRLDNDSGQVQAWRWSSHATTQAIQAQEEGQNPLAAYGTMAQTIMTHAQNSVGRDISPNAVLSDVGQVRFNSAQKTFELQSPSFASGVSGAGMDSKSTKPKELFALGIQAAQDRGTKGSPAQAYHSEPAALFLHNQVRATNLSVTSDAIAMVTSIPNQVCRNCMHTFHDSLGPRGFVSGMSGLPFGGQKPGIETSSSGVGVSKAPPLHDIFASKDNQREVLAVVAHHARK